MMQFGRLTRKAAALGIGRGAGVAAQFALNMALVRFVSQQEFGWFHGIKVVLTFAALLDLGIPLGLLQAAGAANEEQRRDLYRTATAFAFVAGVGSGIVLALSALLPSLSHLAPALAWSSLLIAATIVAAVIESALVVEERHGTIASVSAATAIGGFALALAAVAWRPTVAMAYAALAVAACARAFALARAAGVLGIRAALRSVEQSIPLLKTSLAVSGHRALGIVSGVIDRGVVGAFFSAGTLGWYVTGAWEVPFMSVFFGAIASAILPEMSLHWAADRKMDVVRVWQESVARSAWLIFPVWLWSWIWAPELLRILFTRQYEDGLPVFRVYLLALPVRVAIYSALLLAIEKPRALVTGAVIDVGLNVVLSIGLAVVIGPLGPAIATVVATYAQAGYYLFAVRGELPVSALRLLPWGRLFWALAGAGAVTLPTLVLRNRLDGDFILVGVSSAWIAVVLVSGALYAMRRGGDTQEVGRGRSE